MNKDDFEAMKEAKLQAMEKKREELKAEHALRNADKVYVGTPQMQEQARKADEEKSNKEIESGVNDYGKELDPVIFQDFGGSQEAAEQLVLENESRQKGNPQQVETQENRTPDQEQKRKANELQNQQKEQIREQEQLKDKFNEAARQQEDQQKQDKNKKEEERRRLDGLRKQQQEQEDEKKEERENERVEGEDQAQKLAAYKLRMRERFNEAARKQEKDLGR